METKIQIPFSPKTVKLENGEFLHFWYANNAGRGGNNCTIIRSTAPRAATSAKQQNILFLTLTSSWRGRVNFSKHVQFELGL